MSSSSATGWSGRRLACPDTIVSRFWDCPENRPWESFTPLEAKAYFDNGDTIENIVTFAGNVSPENENIWRYTLQVRNENADVRDGDFTVDVKLAARGENGILHIATDNHPIYYARINVVETTTVTLSPAPVTIRVLSRDVNVLISPSYQSGTPGATLTYIVTVTNTGDIEDSYDLSISDDAGWVLTLLDNKPENVLPGESKTVTLSVTIPENVSGSARNNITVTVTATSRESTNPMTKESATVQARVATEFGVEVEVLTPKWQGNFPSKKVAFTLRAQNRGTSVDNINLGVSDDNGWTLVLGTNHFENVAAGENVYTTLTVSIPGFALPSAIDNIFIVASSERDPTKADSDTCQVRVEPLRAVEVEISPSSQGGKPRQALGHVVKISNHGLLDDLYTLSVEDNGGWGIELSPAQLFVPAGKSRFAALTITVPEWASGRAEDNVVVTALGMLAKGTRTDPENVSGSNSCVAQATLLGELMCRFSQARAKPLYLGLKQFGS
jgi:uncharacterized membrane protein